MPDDHVTAGAAAGTQQSDDTTPQSNVTIPSEVKERFPDLIPMVLASKSMDDDERNYWFSMLPIMTPRSGQRTS